jgi:NADPH:quinone reductase-like Zn-dependent oxidoreductase
MQAVTVRDRRGGVGGLVLTDMPYPHAAVNDVIVRVHAAGFTPGELDWPTTWADRAGRDRTPSAPGHELSGVVVELGYGTAGLTVGQRVFGLADCPATAPWPSTPRWRPATSRAPGKTIIRVTDG